MGEIVRVADVSAQRHVVTGRQRLVSVVVIFLNEARFLTDAVDSVYAQTYSDWELLLVDDGSSDASSELARGYVERDSVRVRYLEHPGHTSLGQGAARNLGVRAAQGEWIAFLDGDDVWLPERLERSVTLALAHTDADMIYGKTEVLAELGGQRSSSRPHPASLLPRRSGLATAGSARASSVTHGGISVYGKSVDPAACIPVGRRVRRIVPRAG